MRKGIYALVVMTYLLLSSGVVVQLHYCMDRLAEIGVFSLDHQDVCGDCGMDMTEDNDCCHDRTDVIKLVQDQTFQKVSYSFAKASVTETASFTIPVRVSTDPYNDQPVFSDPPDPPFGRYRYRALQVFRI